MILLSLGLGKDIVLGKGKRVTHKKNNDNKAQSISKGYNCAQEGFLANVASYLHKECLFPLIIHTNVMYGSNES